MAGRVSNYDRDIILSAFRQRVLDRLEIVPFEHQARWWAASEGLTLIDVESPDGRLVAAPDGSQRRLMAIPRVGGPAKIIADLGAYKIGKSYGAALWASGFAAVPDARVSLVGIEYDICEPEFSYLAEFLLTERGMNLPYKSYQNRPRDGKMWLDLENGARYEAKSWERKDSLKGKEIDAYIFCEAYMLPGIECFTANSQNLRARAGYAVFPTTPDRPWLEEIHRKAHSGEPGYENWHCTCGIDAKVNRFTYDEAARVRDKGLMTREKFAIHYEGKLGDYVGRVFNHQQGQRVFSPITEPFLFKPGSLGTQADLVIPSNFELIGAVDTGTFYTGVLVAVSPTGDAYVVAEFPNYSYAGGQPDRDEGLTIPKWSQQLRERTLALGGRTTYQADKNSQFKRELRAYGVTLLSNTFPLEARTEITREYFQHNKIHFAPWLTVLPFEIENAAWPEEASASGKFARVKDRDHTLDCLEHCLSQRPRGKLITHTNTSHTWVEGFLGRNPRRKRAYDPVLGRL